MIGATSLLNVGASTTAVGFAYCGARRASLRPMAIACLRLVTFLPERPDRSVPCLRSRIARSTFLEAFGPYLRVLPRLFAMHHLARRRNCASAMPPVTLESVGGASE